MAIYLIDRLCTAFALIELTKDTLEVLTALEWRMVKKSGLVMNLTAGASRNE